MTPEPYNVVPVEGEKDRYFVNSRSRPSITHIVDLNYQEESHHKPSPFCGCEAMIARKQKTCPHIEAVQDYIKIHGL